MSSVLGTLEIARKQQSWSDFPAWEDALDLWEYPPDSNQKSGPDARRLASGPKSGRPDSNRRRPAWEAGILPLNYARKLQPLQIADAPSLRKPQSFRRFTA